MVESKLNITEFKNRLKENTVIGNPKLKLISLFRIFGGFSKPFYGNFDDTTFRLTTNSATSLVLFTVKGKYKITNRKLCIDYIIEPTHKFQTIWLKYYPFIAFVLFNSTFIILEKVPLWIILIFNLLILFSLFFTRWISKINKRNLEKKLKEIFELKF